MPVPPIPPQYILRDVLTVGKRSAFIAHRIRGNTIKKYSKICAILHRAAKVLQFGAAAGFELSANGGGAVYSVAVGRRLVRSESYLSN